MARDIRSLSSGKHRTHGWKRPDNLLSAKDHSCSLVLLAEIESLLPHYPLAFAETGTGGYQLVALQALHQNENLCVNSQGKWLLNYLPSFYRGYPFYLHEIDEDGERRGVFCFDHESGFYREEPDLKAGEERFYTDDGQLQPHMQQVLKFLGECATNQNMTRTAVNALEAADLIVPWNFERPNPDSTRPLINGFYCIGESRLNALDAASLKQLQENRALFLAYAQLLSMSRLTNLAQLYAYKYSATAMPQTSKDLDGLVGDVSEEPLNFNWDKL